MKSVNPARSTARVWWIITAVFFVLMFFPFAVDGAPIGVIVLIFSLIMVITGIIAALVYSHRAGIIDRFLRGEGLLAHWKYSPEEWAQYTEKESARDEVSKKTMFFITTGIILAVGIIYALTKPRSDVWIIASAVGVIIIIAFVAWFTWWYNYRQNKKYQGEAFLARDGVYLNRQFHLWGQMGSSLNAVYYVEDSPPLLTFSYNTISGTVTYEYKVHVPVPKGQEARAKELLAEYNEGQDSQGN